MPIIPEDLKKGLPKENQIANNIIDMFNAELIRRVILYKNAFNEVWHAEGVSPQKIFDAFGEYAAVWLKISSLELDTISNCLKLTGQSLDDYLPPADYTPPVHLTVNKDGTVTVG